MDGREEGRAKEEWDEAGDQTSQVSLIDMKKAKHGGGDCNFVDRMFTWCAKLDKSNAH